MPITVTDELLRDLEKRLPPDRLSREAADLHRHSYDASPMAAKWCRHEGSPLRPEVVLTPHDTGEPAALLRWAHERRVSVTPWGAGSSVTGALLADGTEVSTPHMPRASVGPDLRHLLIGAEGTTGVITAATLKMFPLPESRRFECVAFGELGEGLTALRTFMQ